jgi:hypothetical protein
VSLKGCFGSLFLFSADPSHHLNWDLGIDGFGEWQALMISMMAWTARLLDKVDFHHANLKSPRQIET